MNKKWIAINIALLALTALLSWQVRLAIRRFKAENNLAKIQARDSKPAPPVAGPQPVKRYNPADFAIIPAQNLFSDTRSKEEKVEAPPAPEPPMLAIKPVLVGVTMSGNERMAIINDPSGQGRRRTQTKRPGDSYQGYTVTDITSTQMVLENGPRREVIPLFDGAKHQAQTGKTPILSTRIISFGAGGATAPGGQPVGSVAMATPGPRPTTPVGAAAAGNTLVNTLITPAQAQAQQNNAASRTASGSPAARQAPAIPANTAQPAPTWNERTNEQGRRVIRTPFGDIIRDQPTNP